MHSWSMKVVQDVGCKVCQRSVPTMWFEIWVELGVVEARNPIGHDETWQMFLHLPLGLQMKVLCLLVPEVSSLMWS